MPALSGIIIPVTSPAVHFSPGNWAGDAGRGGVSRTTWNSGAYCTWYWTSRSASPAAVLHITNSAEGSAISYFIDGRLVDNVGVPPKGGVRIRGIRGRGQHILTVYMRNLAQSGRWNRANAWTVKDLTLDNDGTPGRAPAWNGRWALEVGDSIKEGIASDQGADNFLTSYAFALGKTYLAHGYDYGLSACGYSGWLSPGDTEGDVPAYFFVADSTNGKDGRYSGIASRWDKLDASASLLDRRGHLSAYGQTNQEPSIIHINYGTNEATSAHDRAYRPSDTQASVTQALSALRRAAPDAYILIDVPFGLYAPKLYPRGAAYISAIKEGVSVYQAAHPLDTRVNLIDLGSDVSLSLASEQYGAAIHPNRQGHAFIAPLVEQAVIENITSNPNARARVVGAKVGFHSQVRPTIR